MAPAIPREWEFQNRVPRWGYPYSCSSRDENQAGCWCWNLSSGLSLLCSGAFVFLGGNSAWSWVELKTQALISTGTFGSGGNPRQGGNQGVPAPGVVSCALGPGKWIPKAIPEFLFCAKSQQLQQEMPLCQHDKAKEPSKDWELLLVTTPGRKKLNLFIPRIGRKP